MNAIDTNVLIYRVDRSDPIKQAKARLLLRRLSAGEVETVLFWQVLGEFVRHLKFWQLQGRMTSDLVRKYVATVRFSFPLEMPTPMVLDHALDLSERHSLSHWDSMILGACKAANVTALYTEDLGSPTQYDGIQLINPFV